MEKGTDLGARNGTRIKKTHSAWLLQVFELPDQRECYSQHRHFLFQKKKKIICCFLSKTGHVCLLQFWQMAVKGLVTKFVYFDSLGMKLNVLLKQNPCLLQYLLLGNNMPIYKHLT